MRRALWIPVLAGLAALLGSGCNDNVGCVFTTGCQGGAGPIATNEAALPKDGDWILDGPPRVEAFSPSGLQNPGTTPIVLVFSESMQERSLFAAFEVVPLAGGGLAGPPIVGLPQALISDGRVLVILPVASGLEAGDYLVRLGEDAVPLDLSGQALDLDPLERVGNFTVATMPPGAPRLVMTFPGDAALNQSETPEIVAVFDRPVEDSSVDTRSFDVRVEGVDPPIDPRPTPLLVQAGTTSVPDTRCYLYRALGLDGAPAVLGTDVEVELRLSPASDPIEEEDGDVLDPATITFRTLPFARPQAASLASTPHDAISLANLTDGDPNELVVMVDLVPAGANDFVDLLLFGEERSNQGDGPLIALLRSVRPSDCDSTGELTCALFLREDVAMQLSDEAGDVRFADGPLTFAFRLRRGNVVTPVRLLDLDPDPDVIEDPLLDTERPVLEDLFGSATLDAFRSDQRGLSLAGKASEPVSVVEVTTPLGHNAGQAVVGSDANGRFLAAPVGLGRLEDGSTTYTMVVRDEVGNAFPSEEDPPLDGTFVQLGGLGSVPLAPGDALTVQVFDSRTLEALAGALVLVHADLGNGTDFPFAQAGTTVADGTVGLTTAGAPSVGAIVTVVRAGYDLFTLHGVPTTRLSIPLRRSAVAGARADGLVMTSDPGTLVFLPDLDLRVDDSRRPPELPRGVLVPGCTELGGVLNCPYGPAPIRDGALGARAFFAGDFQQDAGSFQTSTLLRAFALLVPLAPVDPNGFQTANLEVPFLLDAPTTPSTEAATAVPAFIFAVDPAAGVDLQDLTNDSTPFAGAEAVLPGLPGAVAVAPGLAFELPRTPPDPAGWIVRSAVPGALLPGGSLQGAGAELFVRVEVVDTRGNAAGVRPGLTTLQGASGTPEILALPVPTQLSPPAMTQTGGEAFTLRLTHAIGDTRSEAGLYRIELVDLAGRGWTLWRFDSAGTADVEVRAVDVGDAGGTGLANGTVTSTVSAYAWSSLAATDFMWSDVEREFELFSRAAPLVFSKP